MANIGFYTETLEKHLLEDVYELLKKVREQSVSKILQ